MWHSAYLCANRELFFLDEEGNPTVVAGVPPDYFSETGQRWGNPLYDWQQMSQRAFDWWLARLRTCFDIFDAIRLDHFRLKRHTGRFKLKSQLPLMGPGSKCPEPPAWRSPEISIYQSVSKWVRLLTKQYGHARIEPTE